MELKGIMLIAYLNLRDIAANPFNGIESDFIGSIILHSSLAVESIQWN
jgi:hypothetical protein